MKCTKFDKAIIKLVITWAVLVIVFLVVTAASQLMQGYWHSI